MSDMTAAELHAMLGADDARSDGAWVGTNHCRLLVPAEIAGDPIWRRAPRGEVTRHLTRLVLDYAVRVTPGGRTESVTGAVQMVWLNFSRPLEKDGSHGLIVQHRYFDAVTALLRPDAWKGVPYRHRHVAANATREHWLGVLAVAYRDGEIVGLITPMRFLNATDGIWWHPDACKGCETDPVAHRKAVASTLTANGAR